MYHVNDDLRNSISLDEQSQPFTLLIKGCLNFIHIQVLVQFSLNSHYMT